MIISTEYEVPTDAKAQELWRACYGLERQELEKIGLPLSWTEESKAALYAIDWAAERKEISDKVLSFLKKIRKLYDLNLTPKDFERAELQAKAALLNQHSPASMFAELVTTYIKANPLYYDTKTKMFWYWNFNGCKWEMCEDVDVLRVFNEKYAIMEWIIPSIRMKIIDTIKVFASVKPKDAPKNLIQFKKMVYDMNTDNTFEATPEYFFTNPIPHDLGEIEDTPTIDRFFGEWVGEENKERDKRALYECTAYSLYRAYPIQRVIVMHGEGANGKGTYLRLMRKLLGESNVTATDYDRLADTNQRFEKAKLQNKLMCQLGELEVSMFSKTSVLKEITSGTDLLSAEFKGKNPFDFMNYAKIIINTNRLPISADKTDGFYRRFNIIDFPHQFQDTRDIIAEIPEAEYPNMLRKCVRILKELLAAGKFVNDGTIEDRAMRYEALSNPIKRYIDENYEADPNGFVVKAGFREEFTAYLKNNRMMIMNDREITRALKCCGFTEKVKKIGNDAERVILGIKVRQIDEKVTEVTAVTPIPYKMPHIEGLVEKCCNSCNLCNLDELRDFIKTHSDADGLCAVSEIIDDDTKFRIEDVNAALKDGAIFEPRAGFVKMM